MSRATAALTILTKVLTQTKEKVGALARQGLNIPQYLAGFHDGITLSRWQLQGGEQPELIGEKPEPLTAAAGMSDEEIAFDFYRAQVIDMARDVRLQRAQGKQPHLIPLFDALTNLDEFVATLEKAGTGQEQGVSDANARPQEGSIPSPASHSTMPV